MSSTRQGRRLRWLHPVHWWPRSRVKQFFYAVMSFTVIWSQLLVVQPVDAAISVRGTPTSANSGTSNVTSLTINKPTSTVAGDVMIATISVAGGDTTTGIALAGWTKIIHSANTGTPPNASIDSFYKVATASEGSSYTFSLGTQSFTMRAAGGIVSYAGVDNSSPIDATGTTDFGFSSANAVAPAVTTVSANAWVIGCFTINATNGLTFTPPGSMNERVDTASAHTTNNDSTLEVADVLQAAAGSSGTKTAVGSGSGSWVAHLFALKPSGNATINEMDYRWSVNADNTRPDYIQDNISANDDTVNGTVVDDTNGYFFTVGDNGSNWVIEKRRIADGALCTSTNCGTTFGTGGRVTEDVASSTTEKALSVAVDINDGKIYVVGNDNVPGNLQWRVEKRDMLTGSLDTSFNSTGILQSNPTSSADEAAIVVLDTVNNYVYAGGYDGTSGNEWRVEKYRMSDGAYCTAANCGTQFGTSGVYTNNVSSGDDNIRTMTLDPTNAYLFVAGQAANGGGSKKQWTLYKLHATNAVACTAAECGTQFGTSGVYTSDPDNARDDQLLGLQVDAAADAIYLGGYEATGSSSTRWRMEKISMTTAARDSTFNNASCNSGTGNAVCANFTSGNDKIADISLDGAGGYLYILGVTDEAGTDSGWRVQKRNRSDGSLVSAWATSGTATINPSSVKDPPSGILMDVDRNLLWAAGGDRTLGASNMQWYFAPLSLDTGTIWLDAENTAAAVATTISFRLRLLLGVTTQQLIAGNQSFKLQYSPKVGTCDTGFVGESYQDIPTSGSNEIQYHDNPSVTDGTQAVALTGDPADGSNPTVVESVEESNDFTGLTDVSPGSDGLWDFTLKDNLAFGPYCFRVQTSGGSAIDTYTYVPEITFCRNDPKTDNLLRHGTYFCGGIKKSFFWTN